MKHARFLATCTFSLFVLGFMGGYGLTRLIEKTLEIRFMPIEPLDSLTPRVSLGLLLAVCALSAYALAWAIATASDRPFSKVVFMVGLLVAFTIAGSSILSHLLMFASVVRNPPQSIPNLAYAYTGLNFFGIGGWQVVGLFGLSSLVLLYIARQRKQREIKSQSA